MINLNIEIDEEIVIKEVIKEYGANELLVHIEPEDCIKYYGADAFLAEIDDNEIRNYAESELDMVEENETK